MDSRGFCKRNEAKTIEQVTEEYLNELIQRNLVQLCLVHDLMCDIIVSKADGLDFCQVLDGKKSRLRERNRRLSVCSSAENISDTVKDYSARSIFALNINELISTSFVGFAIEKFKLLKVFDISNTPIDYIPERNSGKDMPLEILAFEEHTSEDASEIYQ